MRNYFRICIVVILAQQYAASQATLQVPGTGFSTIQSALNAALSGDIVEVLPGTYLENLLISDKSVELRAQTRGTVVIDGGGSAPCLKVERSFGTVVDGLMLTNGLGGTKPISGGSSTFGGGIFLDGLSYGPPLNIVGADLVVRFCEIQGCAADNGAGIYCDVSCDLTIEDSVIHQNVSTFLAGLVAEDGDVLVRRCEIRDNGPGSGGVVIAASGQGEFEDTVFLNSAYSAFAGNKSTFRRCEFRGNGTVFGSASTPYPMPQVEFHDCLIVGNGPNPYGSSTMRFPRNALVSNCTIVDNLNSPGVPMIEAVEWAQVVITNSIIRNNGGPDLNVVPPPPGHPWIGLVPLGAITATNSCFSQPEAGFGNHALDPLFVDPALDDYRLKPGSPCIDAGDGSHSYIGSLDLDQRTRFLLDEIDMGCYEARLLAHHPASAGRVGENVGGPFSILEINGSTGGQFRTVTVPIGTASSVAMAQPPNLTAPASFVIFGFLGEADVESALPLPFNIGTMMFAPQPMVPAFLHWLFFTYTDNFNPAAPQFTSSTMTPWNSGLGPAIPFPLTLTLQGVIEESPGNYRTTNAVILRVE